MASIFLTQETTGVFGGATNNAPGGFFAHLAVVDFFLINVFSRLLKPHLSMSTDDCAVDHGIQLNIHASRFSKKF